jgi:CcmD family protein
MDERNTLFMFYGFAAAWAILAGYVLYLGAKEGRLRSQIDTLRRMIEDREERR